MSKNRIACDRKNELAKTIASISKSLIALGDVQGIYLESYAKDGKELTINICPVVTEMSEAWRRIKEDFYDKFIVANVHTIKIYVSLWSVEHIDSFSKTMIKNIGEVLWKKGC